MDIEANRAPKLRKPKADLDSRTFKEGAIYLFRRADYKKPTWFCRVRVSNAKGYVSQSTKTVDEHQAYAFASDLYEKAYIRAATGQEIRPKQTTAALTEFLKEISSSAGAKSPQAQQRVRFLSHIASFFKSIPLKDIRISTFSELDSWILSHSRKGTLTQTTFKRYYTDLRPFFEWCVAQSYIETIPKFPKRRMEENRRPGFDRKDWARLTRHIREFIKTPIPKIARDRKMLVNYVLILANTGIRVGEARILKWRDLREISTSKGSGSQPDVAFFVKGKTGPREVVARTSDVTIYLKRILELRTSELGRKPLNEEYVFVNRDGTPIRSFKKSFASLLKSAGVEMDSYGSRRTIYSLRHTYATFRLEEGVHQYILAKNMGTSVEMLERHYGHTTNVSSAAELTKIGNFRSGKTAKSVDWLLD